MTYRIQEVFLFADDTNLFTTIESTLQVEISNVDDLVSSELEKNLSLVNSKQIITWSNQN